ncbi:MAG: type II toxin-antitoxin system RelE/ParE family toxin [Phycisphaerales bacterium]|nr:type II toxin-antitoxin system RelE/ParE family toxin [Phycisphaerales bacterium]MCB9857667.1 type II toxin-antitoxin system RelE/ParE family toxin [Phycisphaerales bacterium]
MNRYRVSRSARADLADIWQHIAADSLTAADHFIDKLFSTIRTLATQPDMGRLRPELAESVRSFAVGNFVVFYKPMKDGVQIVRVLSGFRDIPNEFVPD